MRRKAAIGAALTVSLLVAAIALALSGGSGGGGAAEGSAGTSGSALVARRTLAERMTVSGTIGFAGERTAVARLSGTITWLPAVGDVVRRGGALYDVAGEPVILMYGEVPAYRTLGEGIAEGEDVRQLEENLAALGFEPGEVDETFTAATVAAVAAWQEDLGLAADGEIELGRVTFLPGPRRVTGLKVTLGESIGSGGAGAPVGGIGEGSPAAVLAAYRPPGLGPGVEAPDPAPGEAGAGPPGKAPDGEAGSPPAAGQADRDEQAEPSTQAPAATGREGETGAGAETGEDGGAEAGSFPVLETTSTRRVVSAELEPDQQSPARRGRSVVVVLPDGTESRGEILRLAAVAKSGEEGAPGSETEAGVEVTVGLADDKRVPALEGATVSVVFTQRVREGVLSVPVTALLAIGGGRYAVVVDGDDGRRIEVTPGLSADGYVEVSGKGLRAGMRVETGE